jgi:putative transposase
LLPGRPGDPGGHGEDNRRFVNAVIWLARTGSPWRDLPERFGLSNSVFQRFNRWSKAGVWERVMQDLQSPDLEAMLLDSTVVRAHQHAAGSPKKRSEWGIASPASVRLGGRGLPFTSAKYTDTDAIKRFTRTFAHAG